MAIKLAMAESSPVGSPQTWRAVSVSGSRHWSVEFGLEASPAEALKIILKNSGIQINDPKFACGVLCFSQSHDDYMVAATISNWTWVSIPKMVDGASRSSILRDLKGICVIQCEVFLAWMDVAQKLPDLCNSRSRRVSIVSAHYEWAYKMHSLLPLVARKLENKCDTVSSPAPPHRSLAALSTVQARHWRSRCESISSCHRFAGLAWLMLAAAKSMLTETLFQF